MEGLNCITVQQYNPNMKLLERGSSPMTGETARNCKILIAGVIHTQCETKTTLHSPTFFPILRAQQRVVFGRSVVFLDWTT